MANCWNCGGVPNGLAQFAWGSAETCDTCTNQRGGWRLNDPQGRLCTFESVTPPPPKYSYVLVGKTVVVSPISTSEVRDPLPHSEAPLPTPKIAVLVKRRLFRCSVCGCGMLAPSDRDAIDCTKAGCKGQMR